MKDWAALEGLLKDRKPPISAEAVINLAKQQAAPTEALARACPACHVCRARLAPEVVGPLGLCVGHAEEPDTEAVMRGHRASRTRLSQRHGGRMRTVFTLLCLSPVLAP